MALAAPPRREALHRRCYRPDARSHLGAFELLLGDSGRLMRRSRALQAWRVVDARRRVLWVIDATRQEALQRRELPHDQVDDGANLLLIAVCSRLARGAAEGPCARRRRLQ